MSPDHEPYPGLGVQGPCEEGMLTDPIVQMKKLRLVEWQQLS